MKKFISAVAHTTVLFFLSNVNGVLAQPSFQKQMDGDIAIETMLRHGDNYILFTTDPLSGSGSAVVLKVDAAGNFIAANKIGLDESNAGIIPNKAVMTSDGGIVFVVTFGSDLHFGFFVCKLDSQLNILWNMAFDATKGVADIILTPDGFMIAAISVDVQVGVKYAYLLRLDGAGNVIWSNEYENEYFSFRGIIPAGSNYVAWGNDFTLPLSTGFFLHKTNGAGSTLWTKSYQISGGSIGRLGDVFPTSDGGFLVTGEYLQSIIYRSFVIKLDSSGNVLSSNLFFTTAETQLTNTVKTADNNYLLLGNEGAFSGFLLMVKVNSAGAILFAKKGDNTALFDYVRGAELHSDGTYVIASYVDGNFYRIKSSANLACLTDTLSFTLGNFTTIVTPVTLTYHSMDSTYILPLIQGSASANLVSLCVPTSTDEQPSASGMIFPNPFYHQLNVRMPADAIIQVFDFLGRRTDFISLNANQALTIGGNYSPGIYFLQIEMYEKKYLQKIVKSD